MELNRRGAQLKGRTTWLVLAARSWSAEGWAADRLPGAAVRGDRRPGVRAGRPAHALRRRARRFPERDARVSTRWASRTRSRAPGATRTTMDFETDQGRRIARWRMDEVEQQQGIPAISLQRAHLQAVLAEACSGHLHLGERSRPCRSARGRSPRRSPTAARSPRMSSSGRMASPRGAPVPARRRAAALPRLHALAGGRARQRAGAPPGGGAFHHRFGRGATVGWAVPGRRRPALLVRHAPWP